MIRIISNTNKIIVCLSQKWGAFNNHVDKKREEGGYQMSTIFHVGGGVFDVFKSKQG